MLIGVSCTLSEASLLILICAQILVVFINNANLCVHIYYHPCLLLQQPLGQ